MSLATIIPPFGPMVLWTFNKITYGPWPPLHTHVILNVGDRPHNACDETDLESSAFPIGKMDAEIDENHPQYSRSGKSAADDTAPPSSYYYGRKRILSGARVLDPSPCYLCARPSYMDAGADGRCRSCGEPRGIHIPDGRGCFAWGRENTIVCPACRAAEGLEDRRRPVARIFPDPKEEVGGDNEFRCFAPDLALRLRPLPHLNEAVEVMAESIRRRLGAK